MKKYKITKEQVLELADLGYENKLKKWFPEVFYLPIDFTGWTKNDKFKGWLGYYEKGLLKYGISDDTQSNKWFVSLNGYYEDDKQATKQEVFEALKNEAVKRGFKEGVMYISAWNNESECLFPKKLFFNKEKNCLATKHGSNECIFQNGIWAEIIKTLTKKEAE